MVHHPPGCEPSRYILRWLIGEKRPDAGQKHFTEHPRTHRRPWSNAGIFRGKRIPHS